MPLETPPVDGIEDLNAAWPTGADPKSQGDDHLRNIKTAVQGSLPNMNGPWNTTSQIVAGGFDASSQVISKVGVPVADTDAARKAETDFNLGLILAVETRLDTAEADILALQNSDTAQNGRLDTAESNISDLQGRVATLEASVAERARWVSSWGWADTSSAAIGVGSGDYSVNRPGTGRLVITFDTAESASEQMSVVATLMGNDGSANERIIAERDSATSVEFRTYTNSALADMPFFFARVVEP